MIEQMCGISGNSGVQSGVVEGFFGVGREMSYCLFDVVISQIHFPHINQERPCQNLEIPVRSFNR